MVSGQIAMNCGNITSRYTRSMVLPTASYPLANYSPVGGLITLHVKCRERKRVED